MKKILLGCVLWGTALIIFLSSCSSVPKAKKVILIGIDGVSVDGFETAKTPNLNYLVKHGAITLKCRGVMPTVSAPNWGAILTGAGPEQNSITKNGWTVKNHTITPIQHDNDGYFPSIFYELKIQRPEFKTAMFYDWAGLGDLINKKYVDNIELLQNSDKVFSRAAEFIKKEDSDFIFIYAGLPDEAGHKHGWGTGKYYKAIEHVDSLVGTLISTLKSQGVFEETHIFVVTDHGGKGYGHGGESMEEIEVPWIIKGPGIIKNRIIKQYVNVYDTAPTIAKLFRLSVPDCWAGKPVQGAFMSSEVSRQNKNVYVPKPKASIKSGIYTRPQMLSFTIASPDAEVRYTIDGKHVTSGSAIFSEPIPLTKSCTVYAAAFLNGKKSREARVDYIRVVEIRSISLLTRYSKKYHASGPKSLIDKKRADFDFHHKAWMGFEGTDLVAVLDMGHSRTFRDVVIGTLKNEQSWIFLPKKIELYTSTNGFDFHKLKSVKRDDFAFESSGSNDIVINIGRATTRYLKVIVRNQGTCPKGHPGQGEKAWLFVDEIMVR